MLFQELIEPIGLLQRIVEENFGKAAELSAMLGNFLERGNTCQFVYAG